MQACFCCPGGGAMGPLERPHAAGGLTLRAFINSALPPAAAISCAAAAAGNMEVLRACGGALTLSIHAMLLVPLQQPGHHSCWSLLAQMVGCSIAVGNRKLAVNCKLGNFSCAHDCPQQHWPWCPEDDIALCYSPASMLMPFCCMLETSMSVASFPGSPAALRGSEVIRRSELIELGTIFYEGGLSLVRAVTNLLKLLE